MPRHQSQKYTQLLFKGYIFSLLLVACSVPSLHEPHTLQKSTFVSAQPTATQLGQGTLNAQSRYDYLTFTLKIPSNWQLQGLDTSQIKYFRLWVKGYGIADRVWNDGGFVEVTGTAQGTLLVQNVPKGRNRIVVAQAYNSAQQPIEGATLAAVYSSPPQSTTVTVYLKWSHLPLGLIMERLLEKNAQLANALDANALQQVLNQILYGTPNPLPGTPFQVHPSRLDPDLIAATLNQQGNIPQAAPADWHPPESTMPLVIRNPHNLAFALPIQLSVNDPASQPWQLNGDTTNLSALPSGKWTLTAKIHGLNGGVQATLPVSVAKNGIATFDPGTAVNPLLLPPVLTSLTAPVPFTATPAGLVSWWRAENNAQDSLNVNHGSTQNGATYGAGVDQAFQLDGIDDYIQIGNVGNLNFKLSDSFTVEAWINPTLSGADRPIFGSSWASPGYLLRVNTANRIRFLVIQSGGIYRGADSAVLTPGWHHVVGTWNGTTMTGFTYVDGVLSSTPVSSGAITNITSTQAFRIGNVQAFGGQFQGKIDEVKVYRRALSATEISESYQNQVVQLQGDGFSSVTANNTPSHGINQTSTTTSMTVLRPAETYGNQNLTVSTAGKTSNVGNYIPPPTIKGVSRPFGIAGTSMTLAGAAFGPGLTDSTVTVNGQNTTVTTANNTQVAVTVPAGASAGPIQLTNGYGTATGFIFTPLPTGLQAWWQFENNGLDQLATLPLTATNGPTFVSGFTQYGVNLDGTDDYLTRPALNAPGDISFCTWILPRSYAPSGSAPNHNPRIFMNYDGVHDLQLLLHEDGFLKWGSALDNQGASTTALPPLNHWTHLTVTRTGATYNIYYNGVLQTMGGVVPGNTFPTLQALRLGAEVTSLNAAQANGYTNGLLDEAMLFNRALSLAEIQAIYNGTIR